MRCGYMKEKKTAYYEPLMELINKKNYNAIWNSRKIKEITYNIGKKIHHNMIDFLIDDGVYYKLEDTYADMYFILVKCVDTYKPYKNDKFINFKTFYILAHFPRKINRFPDIFPARKNLQIR